jgi:caa(3)-type oxidase subunit IV
MADSPEEIKKAQQKYLLIGLILFVFTVVTVAVATQPWLDFGRRGFDAVDASIGLAIATLKASLVAAIFMHLNHEKRMIYLLILFGIGGGISLIGLTAWAFEDPIKYKGFYQPKQAVEE